jgi:predicted O-methyltransferase YrrM
VTALHAEPLSSVLAELHAYAAVEDPLARERVGARRALGLLTTAEKYEVYGDAPPLSISAAEGELLYLLVRAARPALVVEFGASHGISTLYLAAALDETGGRLVTTEIRPAKAAATADNLRRARLDGVVELRVGDALETLRELPGPVGLAFLDGRNDLYLDVLRLLEPQLREGALVVADLSPDDPDLVPYVDYVRTAFTRIPVSAAPGFEISTR